MILAGDGSLQSSDLYGATVYVAKLAYNSVAAWLEGTAQCRKRSAWSKVTTIIFDFRTAWPKN